MFRLLALFSLAATPALAAPRVAADVAPVHSIAAAVMAGVGAPDLIVPPGVSEHDYGLRPSEAAALEAADLVVWVGPTLTPWLEEALDALAPQAARLTLEQAERVEHLAVREGGPFEAHGPDHGLEEHGLEEHGHEEEHAAEAEHEHGAGREHDHTAADPHLWLDPRNGAAIADATAEALATADPKNAVTYRENAAAFGAEMAALEAELAARLKPLRGAGYFVFHDAYQYFENRFRLPAAGSVALTDAEAPRAARVSEIRERFEAEAIDCVFAEPQFEPKLIATLIEGTQTRTGTLDPLGAELAPGPELYPALLRGLVEDLAACLESKS